jgi:excinuclease ABC subunit A
MGVDLQYLIKHAAKFDFPIHKPYYQLTEQQKQLLWTGNEYFEGLNAFFDFLKQNQYKIQYRVMLSRYRGKTTCSHCMGTRLRQEATYVKVGGKAITELVEMPISALYAFFENLSLDEHDALVANRLLVEIKKRIQCLMDVGLSYLTLNRASATLSGGESQRINLVSSLGSSLVGSLYVLDEPSIGLHPRNTDLLIGVLRQLQALGNTVVVVEHDATIMHAADYLIDIGPGAGRLGGEVVFQGNPKEGVANLDKYPNSATLHYLAGNLTNKDEAVPRKWTNYIEVVGATEHNLKNINVKFPLGVISVVTGVSGSGKSTLVKDVLYTALKRHLGGEVEKVGSLRSLQGSLHLVTDVEMVDQNPIGKSSRSNPATYLKAFDEIRRLFADQPLSKQMGYTPGYFSFNSQGGRCDVCQGEGVVTIPMQFMADVVLPCEACHGKRYKSEILEVKYRGVDIHDVLEMTVNQAIEFFAEDTATMPQLIVKRLQPLQDVGLGYVKLGQSSSTLSGGESQRVKLAYFLSSDAQGHKVFLFDEPTTGLHYADIKTLMESFRRLISKGHTVIIIEHNTDVIKQADYLIDLGPEGGAAGGNLVYAGTPQGIKDCSESYTAKYI